MHYKSLGSKTEMFEELYKDHVARGIMEFLRKKIGLGFFEIKSMTIYTESSKHINIKRLHKIYELFEIWDYENLGRMSPLFYDKILPGECNSLIHYLCQPTLEEEIISRIIHEISVRQTIGIQQEKDHEQWLLDHGFEPVSKEQRQENLDFFIRQK